VFLKADSPQLAPAEILIKCKTNKEFGEHCLEHTHPNFRQRVKDGYNIVVAGHAFGCGSSRENAVSALLGVGVICVISKSFAFIYGRNQPNLGLLGITITDPTFYEAAKEEVDMEIDLATRKVKVGNEEWGFVLSQMEKELIKAGGITQAFEKFGKGLFEVMCTQVKKTVKEEEGCGNDKGLRW
jgi:3-isopropylmalate dehydratase small subunit